MSVSRLALGLSVALLGCGARPGSVLEAGGSGESETGVETETESGTETESETETESGTETSSTTEESDDSPEPDLPPERTCVPFEQAQAFDELCFADPVTIDPTPVSHLAHTWPSEGLFNYYVGGAGLHRFHRHADLQGDGSPLDLALPGTTVEARTLRYFAGPDKTYFGILAKDPHALVVLDIFADFEVVAQVELDVEPTSFTDFKLDPYAQTRVLAVVDVAAELHVFELEMGILSRTSTRTLPEPLDELDARPWLWVDGENLSFTELVGRSNASLTAWHLGAPIPDVGFIDAYPLPYAISVWNLGPFSHVTSSKTTLLISTEPSQAILRQAFEFDLPGAAMALAHPVEELDSGYVPWGLGGWFVLSRSDARIGHLATGNGEGTEFHVPEHWIAVPADTRDFLAVGELGFLCAGTSTGLTLISPTL